MTPFRLRAVVGSRGGDLWTPPQSGAPLMPVRQTQRAPMLVDFDEPRLTSNMAENVAGAVAVRVPQHE